jgi:nicotinate-nucleotide adenylyltransferase
VTRIGVFGGSFDPPHLAHLVVAEQARAQAGLDRVLWVPAQRSPLKEDPEPADAHHRLAMVALAIHGHERFGVWDGELRRPGPSYTVDTLRQLREEHPDWDLHLVIGGDSLASFEHWRDPDGIRRLARLVVYPRGEASPAPTGDRATVLDVPRLAVSSTDLRRRVAAGGSIRYFVPDAVLRYIIDHGLYR